MAQEAITKYTCDRCGHEEAIPNSSEQTYAWAKMWMAQANGPLWIGSVNNKRQVDLCERCTKNLSLWFKENIDVEKS